MHVIEFQKCGLPHAHMLIWLHPNDRPKTTDQIDKMVSAEIPDPSIDPVGYEAVKNYMIHGPCGTDCVNSPCMAKGSCTKHFPKRIKGAFSFDDLKTVHGHIHKSFHEACAALGLLQNDQQWHEAIAKNSHTSMPPQLRALFVNIIVYSPISHPRSLWDTHWGCMSDDIVLVRRHLTNNPNLCLSDYDIQNYALAEIEKLLNDIGKSLTNLPDMPFPGETYFSNSDNRLILEQTSYDTEEMKKIHEKKIIKKGGVFFVYGSGGCGKTFLWQTLYCRLRSEHKIVLPAVSCGIAAVLLPGGRTAHSLFHIPLKLDEHCSAGLRHGTDISELIQQTDLIFWDEAPMQHRHEFEFVDRSLRDIMSDVDKRRAKKPFGGITIVFGGDFGKYFQLFQKRQVLK
ncbi:uncharacterized protein LOC141674110 [Apium graveolens]|uniref:uncharacterized protein LOC141674110 n=1 Tax=Apium graveolens TaxID=4045 RepID=UPI003D78C67D